MTMIEKINKLSAELEGKLWNKETELALDCLMEKNLSLKEKSLVLTEMFPEKEWTIPSIASKERRMK